MLKNPYRISLIRLKHTFKSKKFYNHHLKYNNIGLYLKSSNKELSKPVELIYLSKLKCKFKLKNKIYNSLNF